MKMKKYIWIGITLVWACVIFSFSMQTESASNELSHSLFEKICLWILPNLQDEPETLGILHVVFRKLAHFAEYFILGVCSQMTLFYFDWKNKVRIGVGFCIFVAILDETIQLFSKGRGARVTDVLLDSVGALAGVAFLCLCIILMKRKSEKSIKNS